MRVVSLEERCDELEQYSHCNMVRIRGLTETANEDTDGLVKHLAARWLGVKIEDSDVVRSHRAGKRAEDRSTPRDIIVRFTTHKTHCKLKLTFNQGSHHSGLIFIQWLIIVIKNGDTVHCSCRMQFQVTGSMETYSWSI